FHVTGVQTCALPISTGVIYRQFSATIVSAMALSVLVALILTPALCATILKPLKKGEQHGTRGFFGWFNRNYNRGARLYQGAVQRSEERRVGKECRAL